MKWFPFVVVVQLGALGCAESHDIGPGSSMEGALPLPVELTSSCLDEVAVAQSDDFLPEHLSCTGLYSDMAKKQVAKGVQRYEPAYSLWADGLQKARYVYLPPGTTIDASQPSAWVFPVGTRFWKEFQSQDGSKPVETRLYLKRDASEWRQITYEWDAALKDAKRVDQRKDVMVGTLTHTLPEQQDCEDCHKGRRDRILGFEQVLLGLPQATGVTLADLVAQKRLKNFEGPTEYHIGPDDESAEAYAFGFLHANCGVTCHNDNSNSTGHMVNMKLRLDPAQLDGGDTSGFDAVTTTVGVATQSFKWPGKMRVAPGSPDDSWLLVLMSMRGDPMQQMPPLASNLVDEDDSDWVRTWISNLPKP
jgi:hypothetical protein